MESYLPVEYVYREIAEAEIARAKHGKVFYFDARGAVESEEGKIKGLEESAGEGLFLRMENDRLIRMDRVITLFGKPGAAYDEYDAYANACLSCTGGYDL